MGASPDPRTHPQSHQHVNATTPRRPGAAVQYCSSALRHHGQKAPQYDSTQSYAYAPVHMGTPSPSHTASPRTSKARKLGRSAAQHAFSQSFDASALSRYRANQHAFEQSVNSSAPATASTPECTYKRINTCTLRHACAQMRQSTDASLHPTITDRQPLQRDSTREHVRLLCADGNTDPLAHGVTAHIEGTQAHADAAKRSIHEHALDQSTDISAR